MLDKNCSVDGLIAVIESSNNKKLRQKSLKLLIKSKVHNNEIFNLLENLIISDSNPMMRSLALKEIFFKYKNRINTNKTKTISLLMWILEHESSAAALLPVARFIIFTPPNELPGFLDLLKQKISHLYGVGLQQADDFQQAVCFEEALVLLRLDYLFKKKFPYKEEYFNTNKDSTVPEYYSVSDAHIKELRIVKFRNIPPIIKRFTKLTRLELTNCVLNEFPTFLLKMQNLESLYLKNTFLSNSKKMSKSILKFAIDKSSIKYVKMGVIPSNAVVLGLLEIFSTFGINPKKYDNIISYDDIDKICIFFKTNDNGQVEMLGINCLNNLSLRFFPSLISLLTNLKRLRILELFSTEIKEIPESISRLERLEYLDVSYNNIKKIPESLAQLKNLEYLEIIDNKVYQISNLDVIFKMQSLVGLDINYKGLSLLAWKNYDEIDSSYRRFIRKEISEVKNQLTYSQQLLYYQYNKRHGQEIKKEFDEIRDFLYQHTSCKHERKIEHIYPRTYLCADCKETLELWKYGLINYC